MTSRDPLIKVMWAAKRKFRRIQHGGGTEVLWPVSGPAVNTEFCSVRSRQNLCTGRVFINFFNCKAPGCFKVLWEAWVSKRSFGPAAGRRPERPPDSSSEVNNRQRLPVSRQLGSSRRDLNYNLCVPAQRLLRLKVRWTLRPWLPVTGTEITPNSIQNTADLASL